MVVSCGILVSPASNSCYLTTWNQWFEDFSKGHHGLGQTQMVLGRMQVLQRRGRCRWNWRRSGAPCCYGTRTCNVAQTHSKARWTSTTSRMYTSSSRTRFRPSFCGDVFTWVETVEDHWRPRNYSKPQDGRLGVRHGLAEWGFYVPDNFLEILRHGSGIYFGKECFSFFTNDWSCFAWKSFKEAEDTRDLTSLRFLRCRAGNLQCRFMSWSEPPVECYPCGAVSYHCEVGVPGDLDATWTVCREDLSKQKKPCLSGVLIGAAHERRSGLDQPVWHCKDKPTHFGLGLKQSCLLNFCYLKGTICIICVSQSPHQTIQVHLIGCMARLKS